MRSELLKSPYLVELGALHLNLSAAEQETISLNEMVGEFSCDFESSSPTLTCCLLGSAKLDFELTCSICLVREVNLLRSAPQVRVYWIKRIRDCPSYKLALIRHRLLSMSARWCVFTIEHFYFHVVTCRKLKWICTHEFSLMSFSFRKQYLIP